MKIALNAEKMSEIMLFTDVEIKNIDLILAHFVFLLKRIHFSILLLSDFRL